MFQLWPQCLVAGFAVTKTSTLARMDAVEIPWGFKWKMEKVSSIQGVGGPDCLDLRFVVSRLVS